MRRSVKVWKVWRPCRTEARAIKRHPALTPISASVGEGKNNKLTAAGCRPVMSKTWAAIVRRRLDILCATVRIVDADESRALNEGCRGKTAPPHVLTFSKHKALLSWPMCCCAHRWWRARPSRRARPWRRNTATWCFDGPCTPRAGATKAVMCRRWPWKAERSPSWPELGCPTPSSAKAAHSAQCSAEARGHKKAVFARPQRRLRVPTSKTEPLFFS